LQSANESVHHVLVDVVVDDDDDDDDDGMSGPFQARDSSLIMTNAVVRLDSFLRHENWWP
jgi:hypothetical protein